MKLTREELRDELWDALMNRQDIDVSLTDLADACLERMDEIGIEAVVSGLLARPDQQVPGSKTHHQGSSHD
jgi:hypothetical protein